MLHTERLNNPKKKYQRVHCSICTQMPPHTHTHRVGRGDKMLVRYITPSLQTFISHAMQVGVVFEKHFQLFMVP